MYVFPSRGDFIEVLSMMEKEKFTNLVGQLVWLTCHDSWCGCGTQEVSGPYLTLAEAKASPEQSCWICCLGMTRNPVLVLVREDELIRVRDMMQFCKLH